MGARGRNIGDFQCGQVIDRQFIIEIQRLYNRLKSPQSLQVVVDDVHVIGINLMGQFRRLRERDDTNRREQIREKFIKKKLTEKNFKKQMLQVVELAEYMQERLQIYDTVIHAITDIMYRLLYDLRDLSYNSKNYDHILNHVINPRVISYKTETNALIVYAHKCLRELASAFREPFIGLI